ncbi:MAG: hypothetical protein L0Y71_04075 [Gemmataceae bacterium]|nr:hypothetical protein [Gemmataceae bacterium]
MFGRTLTALFPAVLSALTALAASPARAEEGDPSAHAAGVAAFAEGKRLLAAGKDARAAFQRSFDRFSAATDSARLSAADGQNIGNAAFLAGDLPSAIAAFRAGLILDRHQPVLRANLAYARAQVQYPPGQHGRPEADPWPAWLPRWQVDTLVRIGGGAYAVAWLASTVWLLRRRNWLAWLALAGFAVAACAGYGWWLHWRQSQIDRDFPPVVIRNDTSLWTGNGPSYPRHLELPQLRRGMEARRLTERGGWLLIQFASGETGWIDGDDAWVIAPSDGPRPFVTVRALHESGRSQKSQIRTTDPSIASQSAN